MMRAESASPGAIRTGYCVGLIWPRPRGVRGMCVPGSTALQGAAAATQGQLAVATQAHQVAVVVYHVVEALQYYLGHWFSMVSSQHLKRERYRN